MGTNPDSPEAAAAPRALNDPGALPTFHELTRVHTRGARPSTVTYGGLR